MRGVQIEIHRAEPKSGVDDSHTHAEVQAILQREFTIATNGRRLLVLLDEGCENVIMSWLELWSEDLPQDVVPLVVALGRPGASERNEARREAGFLAPLWVKTPNGEQQKEQEFIDHVKAIWQFWFGRRGVSDSIMLACAREFVRDAYISRFLMDAGIEEDSHHKHLGPKVRQGVCDQKDTLRKLWPRAFRGFEDEKVFAETSAAGVRDQDLLRILQHHLPQRRGVRWAMKRVLRPKILVIDDEAQTVCERLAKLRISPEEEHLTFGHLCDFFPLPDSEPSDFESLKQSVSGFLSRPGLPRAGRLQDVRSADFILLDLSMKQKEKEELAGFEVLRMLNRECPEIPVIIHSSFADYRNVIRAVQNGAFWFKEKVTPEDPVDPLSLLAVLEDIDRRFGWKREARRININRFELSVNYLHEYFWSKLAYPLPEGRLKVSPLGAGIGGATTNCVSVLSEVQDVRGETTTIAAGTFIAKIDTSARMVSERERYRRFVHPYLGSRAGRVQSKLVTAENKSAIAYSYSGVPPSHEGGENHTTESLDGLIKKNLGEKNLGRRKDDRKAKRSVVLPFSAFAPVFEELFDSIGRMHVVRQPDRQKWADHAFTEFLSLRDTYSNRLPADFELVDVTLREPELNFSIGENLTEEGQIVSIQNAWIQDMEGKEITIAGYWRKGLFRAKLKNAVPLGRDPNSLRSHQRIGAIGKIERRRAEALEQLLDASFTEDDRKQVHALFDEHGLREFDPVSRDRDGQQLIDRILEMLDALSAGSPRVPTVARERIGIVHGDLNLGNVLVERTPMGGPSAGTLWLIDFAASRRDSLAHDFAECEADLLTLLREEYFENVPVDLAEFFSSLNSTALAYPEDLRKSPQLQFLFDAVQTIRRAASKAGVSKAEYLSALAIYHLVVLKISGKKKFDSNEQRQNEQRQWVRRLAWVAATVAARDLSRTQVRLSYSRAYRVTDGSRTLLSVSTSRLEQSTISLKPITYSGHPIAGARSKEDEVLKLAPVETQVGKGDQVKFEKVLALPSALKAFEEDRRNRFDEQLAISNLDARLETLTRSERPKLQIVGAPRFGYVMGQSTRRKQSQSEPSRPENERASAPPDSSESLIAAEVPTVWCMEIVDVYVSPTDLDSLQRASRLASRWNGTERPFLELVTKDELRARIKGEDEIAEMSVALLDGPRVRVSASGLCRIRIGNRLLLGKSRSRATQGRDVLTPLGGAFEFKPSARKLLQHLGAEFEKGSDLRMSLPLDRIEEFGEWFRRPDGREPDGREASPLRELKEELIDEYKVPVDWTKPAKCEFASQVCHTETTERPGHEGEFTFRFLEIFDVELSSEMAVAIEQYVDREPAALAGEGPGTESDGLDLRLLSESEIRTADPATISSTVMMLLS